MRHSSSRMVLGFALLTALATAGFAEADDDFYAGKIIRLLIPTPAGGSYDAYARVLAMHMPDHIPGRPTIIAEN
ncbi:MAG TPA: tricarboxylate transporter, partial [Beijerinckiaceae bacterium]|nr:tricarboxylate transporter [Beijerinckiaceae bacterium]